MTIAEVYKFVRENGLGDFVNKEEVTDLVRLVNKELMRSDETKTLEYDAFVKYIF